MKVIYSFNKRGYEASVWARELAAASTPTCEFIPFNHDPYLDLSLYLRAQLLDNTYFVRHPGLFRLYEDMQSLIQRTAADVLLVDTGCPYHPDWLRSLRIYKALRIADGPLSAYDRDFAYLHAFDQILYHSPAYSADMGMAEKLRYCGARRASLWSLGVFDAALDPALSEEDIMLRPRGIDIVFVGALHVNKMPLLAKVKRAFRSRCRLYGLSSVKRNLYFNLRFGLPGWVRPIRADRYVPLYEQTKIGFNVHNRGLYTVGSYRLFELPANGVMQLSDGGEYLETWFRRGEEIVQYDTPDDLIEKLEHYLEHGDERRAIALAGYRRVMREHRMSHRMRQLEELLGAGLRETSLA